MLKTLSTDAEQIDLPTMTLVLDREARTGQVWSDPEAEPAELEAEWQDKALPILADLGELHLEDDCTILYDDVREPSQDVLQFTF